MVSVGTGSDEFVGMSTPLVSVMMPARNEAGFIGDAIRSILKQTYTNWELIIVDDKSTDGTKEIALEFARRDDRIRVIDGDGICSGNARNKAIDAARGKYIMNMDADDVSVPERIEKLLAVACQYPQVVVGSAMAFVDLDLNVKRVTKKPTDNVTIRRKLRRLWGRAAITPGTIMASADLLRQYKYNEFYKVMVDWDLILRLAENEAVVFANVPEPLYLYRLNSGSMTLNQGPRVRYNILVRYNELQRRKGRPEIRSLEEFEAMVRESPTRRIAYNSVLMMKRIQHTMVWMKHRAREAT
jgi:glycosyltransferase involved in cell wall biosynthesis